MAQLHIYVPKDVETRIRQKAAARGLSVSRFLAELVKREVSPAWPSRYFSEVVGGWKGDPLSRPLQGEFEERDEL